MAWLEQKIRRYEHMRWAQEPNRRTLPFAWGLEHIGGSAKEADPRGVLDQVVDHTLAHINEGCAGHPAAHQFLARADFSTSSSITRSRTVTNGMPSLQPTTICWPTMCLRLPARSNLRGRATIVYMRSFFARGIPGRRLLCWRNGTRVGKS